MDDAYALVAENSARLAGRDMALADVQVGATDSGLEDFDDGVRGGRNRRDWLVLQGDGVVAVVDECLHREELLQVYRAPCG